MMTKIKNFLSFKVKYLRFIFKSFLLETLMPNVHEVLVNTNFGKMIIDPLDNHVSRQLLKTGNYNPQEISSIKKLLRKSDCVMVCGAHVGSLAIPLASTTRKVVAIEANPRNFSLLNLNIAINSIINIDSYNFAAAEKKGTIKFVLNTENSGGSKRKPLYYKNNYYYDKPKIINVDAFPLDIKLKDKFDVVIMDIEGSEFFAIAGMQRILKGARIFIFEFIPSHLTDVAGVTIKEFVENIPIKSFKNAYFPRLGKTISIDKLELMLNLIAANASYEDGIVLS